MQLSTVRILVVDDFEMFRQFVVELLGKRPELQVVGEASDGLEAIQKAVELRPDLILLDGARFWNHSGLQGDADAIHGFRVQRFSRDGQAMAN